MGVESVVTNRQREQVGPVIAVVLHADNVAFEQPTKKRAPENAMRWGH